LAYNLGEKTMLLSTKMKAMSGLSLAFALAACAYPSNVVNDIAHMGDPTYDNCRRGADTLSDYGARCAHEADPAVKAAKAEQARQVAEQQRLAAQAAQQRAEAQDSADAARGYSRITVRDFVLDGKGLAGRSAKVSVTGVYMPAGELEFLFGNRVDAIQFASGDGRNFPTVHLLTDDAARDFRSQLLSCRSNPAAASIGCPVRILGTATMCLLTRTFGVHEEVPCLSVDDGRFTAP
jgi:hypothetical protein